MDLLNQSIKENVFPNSKDDEMMTRIDPSSAMKDKKQGILLIDINDERIQLQSKADLARKLGCKEDEMIKVVSIFGNTGDGKSHTLNHAFFQGEEVFATSTSQTSCTIGVWAAYDEQDRLMIVDTEGLLSTSNNANQRKRLLMKILAISDVIIYRSKAERLHSDMFTFLADASKAYLKHFSPELKAAIDRGQLNLPLCSLGPAVVIFHETHFTDFLGAKRSNPGESISADEILRQRFEDVGRNPEAFSSIKYVGTKTNHNCPTDFQELHKAVVELANDNSVRSRRSLAIVYNVLCHLNEKFKGEIESVVPDTFPDSYFTCLTRCQCCHVRCEGTMNHIQDGTPHHSKKSCFYKMQYDNKYYTCKACHQRGKENLVTSKTYASCDDSLSGLANYAWSGYVIECPECGVIYRSRQYWYGNNDPEKTVLRTHIKHVWQGEHFGGVNHTGRRVVDALNFVKQTVGAVSQTPTTFVKDLVSDAIAPKYWVPNSEIKECHACRHIFAASESKHHCRACGHGFCYNCSDFSRPVPGRGWGNVPVKVCKKCFDGTHEECQRSENDENLVMKDASALNDCLDEEDEKDDLRTRKFGEVIQYSASAIVQVIERPCELIKDVVRPSYWIADIDIVSCACCNYTFQRFDSKHHCRACGQGVCGQCSTKKRAVPNRGWGYPVRVCDTCIAMSV